MARRKNTKISERALELYKLDVLTTEDKRKNFDALSESEREKKVNGYISRNKGLFVGVKLSLINSLNGAELNKLKQDLHNHIKEIEIAEKNINERQIERLEKQKAELKKQHENELKKINAQIEKLRNQ